MQSIIDKMNPNEVDLGKLEIQTIPIQGVGSHVRIAYDYHIQKFIADKITELKQRIKEQLYFKENPTPYNEGRDNGLLIANDLIDSAFKISKAEKTANRHEPKLSKRNYQIY